MIDFLLHDGRILEPVDYEEITVSTSAIGLSVAKIRAAMCCYVRFESGPMRYRVDDVSPTAAVGLPAFDGQEQFIWGPALGKFKAIRSGSVDGAMRVVFCKPIVGWGEYVS